ncbi:MAG: ABC transporter ATP-binding protein [Hyphomicrobiales bacterium]
MIAATFRWLEKAVDPLPSALPEKPPATLVGFIFHYSKPFWPLILASSALATAVALVEVSLFAFLGHLVDWLNASDRATFWQDHWTTLAWMSFVVLIGLPFLKYWYECIVHQGLLGNFAMYTRWQAHRYVLRQSMDFFQNDFAGRVATKVMQAALAVREVVMKISEILLYVAVYFSTALVMFAACDVRLAVPLAIWLAGYIAAMLYFIPKLQVTSKEQSEARSMVTGRIVDSYTNIATVKMFAHTAREDSYARDGMDTFLDTVYRQMRLVTQLILVLNTLNALLLFSVSGLALYLWQVNVVTTGAIAFTVSLLLRLQGMSHWIMWEVSGLFENLGIVQDSMETIARERAVVDVPNPATLAVLKGEVRYDAIHFNYGKHRAEHATGIIHDLSLTVKPGEKVGLVGRSGAGKSTIVSLLLRFYDVEGGRILIDGQDIAKVSQESLRANIGVVTQDTSLLHRSVIDNIRYGRPDATFEQVVDAARRAHALEFIERLEDPNGRKGFEAHVGERGVKLSGGQRQRIAIARVLLKNAPILVLDEATSALDSEVEAAIQESLYSLMEGKTVIAIAHRLSTIAAMDRLVIMDAGRIVEQGTHADLLRQRGLYAQLWQRQSGGFLATEDPAEPAAAAAE